jgi:hypothetical protein
MDFYRIDENSIRLKMKPHTKIYMGAMGFDISDFIPCEICGTKAVDIHHIEARGMGGTSQADTIENLMAVCRPCHKKYGDKERYMERLKMIHSRHLYYRT